MVPGSWATRKLCPEQALNDVVQKSACRKSHQKVLRDALVSTNGVVPSWSAERKQSTSAVTTTVNSLLSDAPPFLPFFCIGPINEAVLDLQPNELCPASKLR
jgi:hypothetical protein